MKRRTIIAANWKMNGSFALAEDMVGKLNSLTLSENVDVVLNVPSPYLATVTQAVNHKSVFVGAQNMSEFESGAYTGEISAAMLKEFDVSYVILGHSERRSIYKETSHHVALKVEAALNAGLTPILCIGESEQERATGETETVLASQLQPVIDQVGIDKFANVVVAYEPVWAIGTGKTASPEMAQETHAFIREFLKESNEEIADNIVILYGGSVNAGNSNVLFSQPDIDGGLIGGASLKVDEFATICLSA